MVSAWPVAGQPVLRWKTRRAWPATGASATSAPPLKRLDAERRHIVVRFTNAPGPEEAEEFERRGALWVQYVPDDGLLLSVPDDFQPGELGLLLVGAPAGAEKISPALFQVLSAQPTGWFVAEFYPDVRPGDARTIALRENMTLREHPDLLDYQLLVEGTIQQALALAGWDEVAYLFPASPELVRGEAVRVCAGAITELGPVGQYIAKVGEGWDGPGRGAAQLRYTFQRLTARLPADALRSEIERALAEWSRYVQVDFQAGLDTAARRNLNFLFAARDHGDPYPFDGRGRMLAHTFYPAPPNPEPVAGDLHFDEEESWGLGTGIDVHSVVLHELGHALGLGHADAPEAVMYPYYRRTNTLSADDIAAIRDLYAARTPDERPPEPTPPPVPSPRPEPAPPPAPTPPVEPDRTAPTLKIVWPQLTTMLTSTESITLQGRAWDNVRVSYVAWTSSTSGGGRAQGTTNWMAGPVGLLRGNNQIVVRAYDAAGNSAWRSILVVRR